MMPTWVDLMIKTIADLGRSYLEKPIKKHTLKSIKQLCEDLLNRRGEASSTALAKDVVDAFNRMTDAEKMDFLEMLSKDFSPDEEGIAQAAQQYLDDRNFDTMQNLSASLDSPRIDLIRMLNFSPGGMPAIIKMREIVLRDLKQRSDLQPLEADLYRLLSSWFNRGFLDFQQINWDTPAAILEKIIAYEAVHEIKGWKDLRRRLAEDRSCFAFFHPAFHHEPLIFVQVAYTKGIAREIQPLLTEPAEEVKKAQANTAIFYSISNAQFGLKGISFGNFLIKQVVDYISKEIPSIKTFSTLSPIPKFKKWLEEIYLDDPECTLTKEEKALISKPFWFKSTESRDSLKKSLIRLCAQYLVNVKKGSLPYDPVTRFHLGNGAEIENINWEADISNNGFEQSIGLMVNYKYTPAQIVANHEAYLNEGKICISSKVKKILES